jgi:hypothetical protein
MQARADTRAPSCGALQPLCSSGSVRLAQDARSAMFCRGNLVQPSRLPPYTAESIESISR